MQLFYHILIQHWERYSKFINTGTFPTIDTICKKPSQMHTTQNPDLFFTYLENFFGNTGNESPNVVDGEVSVNQSSTSSPLAF